MVRRNHKTGRPPRAMDGCAVKKSKKKSNKVMTVLKQFAIIKDGWKGAGHMKKLIPVITAIVLIIVVVAISVGVKVMEKYSYSKERADLEE